MTNATIVEMTTIMISPQVIGPEKPSRTMSHPTRFPINPAMNTQPTSQANTFSQILANRLKLLIRPIRKCTQPRLADRRAATGRTQSSQRTHAACPSSKSTKSTGRCCIAREVIQFLCIGSLARPYYLALPKSFLAVPTTSKYWSTSSILQCQETW
jgi:hypothetical protein